MANPFDQIPVQSDPHLSYSPDTSYLRTNIAVPTVTYGKSAAQVATDADTELESHLPTTITTAAVPTPASTAA